MEREASLKKLFAEAIVLLGIIVGGLFILVLVAVIAMVIMGFLFGHPIAFIPIIIVFIVLIMMGYIAGLLQNEGYSFVVDDILNWWKTRND